MKFLREHWFHIAGFLLVGLLIFMLFFKNSYDISQLQVILIYAFMALLAHQIEEFVFPGGGAIFLNKGQWKEQKNFNRYPCNMQTGVVINVIAWEFYITAIVFPQFIWLGLGVILIGFGELIAHAFIWNKGMKTWYNPGLATTIFLLVPVSSYYIYFISTNHLVANIDWILGFVMFAVILLVVIILPTQLLKNPQSPYAFSQLDVAKAEKVRKFATLERRK